jgi:hypothetical protein
MFHRDETAEVQPSWLLIVFISDWIRLNYWGFVLKTAMFVEQQIKVTWRCLFVLALFSSFSSVHPKLKCCSTFISLMLAAALHHDLKIQFTGLSFVLYMSLRRPLVQIDCRQSGQLESISQYSPVIGKLFWEGGQRKKKKTLGGPM